MGGGGGLLSGITEGLFGSPQTVDTPDYTGAAQQTAAANAANNRINQVTPYGNSTYVQTGTDQYGNPTYTMNTTAAPGIQNAINAQMPQLAATYGSAFQSPTFNSTGDMPAMNYYGSRLNQQQFNPATQLLPLPKFDVNTQIDQSKLPSYGINPGETYENAIMRRLEPTLQRQSASSDAQLANQGIVPGTRAYETAKQLLAQQQNDARTSAIVGGMDTGLRANQQAFGQGATQVGLNLAGQEQSFTQPLRTNVQNMSANELAYNQQLANQSLGMNAQQQAFVQAMAKYMAPAQVAGLLKNLSTPTYAPTNTIPGVDYLSAMGLTNQSQQANANATNAQNNAMISGLFNLGGAAIKYSDIRMKENIKSVGALPNGLNVYEFDYKPEFKDIAGHGKHIGVMAQEVEKIMPYAIVNSDNGYKMVNYSMLGI
jgi:hypothetical protein